MYFRLFVFGTRVSPLNWFCSHVKWPRSTVLLFPTKLTRGGNEIWTFNWTDTSLRWSGILSPVHRWKYLKSSTLGVFLSTYPTEKWLQSKTWPKLEILTTFESFRGSFSQSQQFHIVPMICLFCLERKHEKYIVLAAYTEKKGRARPGFEPGTSRTLSGNHTPRPTSHEWWSALNMISTLFLFSVTKT